MELGLSGRVVLVCGGSRGLGFGCASVFAQEGSVVALAARGEEDLRTATERLENEAGATTMGFTANLDLAADRESLVARVEAALGPIDILVTNNGGPPAGGVDDVAFADYQLALERNLLSAIHLTHLVLPGMRERGLGRIIHIASISVVQPIPGLLLSNVSRLGLAGFSKTVSAEVAKDGVRMHVVCPGSHETERIYDLARARAAAKGTSQEVEMDGIVSAIPVGRLGDPEELGALVAFLASDRAGFMTGLVIPSDGGAYRGTM
jgi:3-oxoacyl-[acyl-carrier protein] reductase